MTAGHPPPGGLFFRRQHRETGGDELETIFGALAGRSSRDLLHGAIFAKSTTKRPHGENLDTVPQKAFVAPHRLEIAIKIRTFRSFSRIFAAQASQNQHNSA